MNPTAFVVHGLFGSDREIPLDLTSNVSIIFGVNGAGKTTVLKLLNALLTGRIYEIRRIRFNSLILQFNLNESLQVIRKEFGKRDDRGVMRPNFVVEIVHYVGTRVKNRATTTADVEFEDRYPMDMIEREIPEIERLGRREWADTMTGEILSFADVIEKYPDRMSWARVTTEIAWYRELVSENSVKFIQTQRLISVSKSDSGRNYGMSASKYKNTVIDYSEKLVEQIRDTLSSSMRKSQSLDNTYPRRLLYDKKDWRLTDMELERLLSEVALLGDKLRSVNLLSESDAMQVSISSIGEKNRRAISLYLTDSKEKFTNLEAFADKLLLFLNLVNSKFAPAKTLKIVGTEGIRIESSKGDIIPPALLSSGEQHELVLLFELIFFSKPGTLVLIDEPEISLHIDWQKKFISDVESIGFATGLRFLLATHSPAIIGNRVELCQEI